MSVLFRASRICRRPYFENQYLTKTRDFVKDKTPNLNELNVVDKTTDNALNILASALQKLEKKNAYGTSVTVTANIGVLQVSFTQSLEEKL